MILNKCLEMKQMHALLLFVLLQLLDLYSCFQGCYFVVVQRWLVEFKHMYSGLFSDMLVSYVVKLYEHSDWISLSDTQCNPR